MVDRAKGHTVWDVEGRSYLDFFGGVLTVSVGHANDDVNARVIEQLERVQHTSTLYVNEIMARVAERVATLTPGRLQKCFFTSSGADALLGAARRRGLLIGKGGLYNNVIRIAPHLTVDAKEIDQGVELLEQALRDVAA